MSEMTLEMAIKNGQSANNDRHPADPVTALDRSYGQIGISAVAAAARYLGSAKNPAYAPTPGK